MAANEPAGSIRGELASLVLLSLGGLLLHVRIHPPPLPGMYGSPLNLVPFVFGLAGAIAVPLLLSNGRTWLTGYLINGFSVITGTVIMAWLGISGWKGPPALDTLIFDSMLASILLLLPKLIVGQKVLRHYRPSGTGRMFTPFWWTRHFFYVSAVFAAGRILGGR